MTFYPLRAWWKLIFTEDPCGFNYSLFFNQINAGWFWRNYHYLLHQEGTKAARNFVEHCYIVTPGTAK